MSNRRKAAFIPQTPLDEANSSVDLSPNQLRNTLSLPGKAPKPAGLTDREGARLLNNENLELRLQLQQVQSQLKLQQLYQGAAHVMVQRSAQLEIDLDQTAAMLCDEMAQGAQKNAAMAKLQELYALEQQHYTLALTALSGLNIQCCSRNQEVQQCNQQLSAALAKLKAAETVLAQHKLSVPSASTTICPTAAMGDVPRRHTLAAPSALASSAPPVLPSYVLSRCSAAQSPGLRHQLQRQRSSPCW